MAESSAVWDGTATGDATVAPYDAGTEFASYVRGWARLDDISSNFGGVIAGALNALAVTAAGSVSPASVNTGRAINIGTWYENTAAVSVTIPTPSVSTRVDRIVLRKDWTLQTVRVTRIAGVEGGGTPALVQSLGTTWDMPLATCSITTGGVVTVTDGREYVGHRFPQAVTFVSTVGFAGAVTITSASANAFAVGRLGATTPAFNVDASTAVSITGVQVKSAAAGGNVTISAIGEANVSLLLAGIGTGIVQTTATTASATVGAFKGINSNASGVGMAVMLANLAAFNAANAAELGFSGLNASSAEVQFGAIRVTTTTTGAGVEAGTMILRVKVAGTMTTAVTIDTAAKVLVAVALDLSGVPVLTGFKLPQAAGAVPTVLGNAALDTTSLNPVFGDGTVTRMLAQYRLASTLLGSDTASITFSAIPGTFKHLKLIGIARGDGAVVADNIVLQFNGDTAGNYDYNSLFGLNSVAGAGPTAAATSAKWGSLPGASAARANIFGANEVTIPNYALTTAEKGFISSGGFSDSTVANSIVVVLNGSWRNTAIITAIKLFCATSTNFKAGTIFTLYGYN